MPWLVCTSPSEDWTVIPPSRHSRHGPRRRGRTQDRTPRTSQRCGPGETFGSVAQLVEPPAVNRVVVGSSPTASANAYGATHNGPSLCAVCKRQGENIYFLTGSGLNKMNGCDRHTGAGLKSSVVIRRCCLCEEAEAVNGCGVVTAIERLGRCVGLAEQSAAPETV